MPRVIGKATTSSASEVALNATTYTEQTGGAQRALKSSSANDTAAGTGARTVRVTFYTLASDGTITGPFSETVILAGTVAVAMVATTLALIEKMEVLTAGSGGVAAGTIICTAVNDGTGATIASIAAADVRTWLGHHYVPTGGICQISDLEGVGGDAAAALIDIKRLGYPSGQVEQSVCGPYGATSALPRGVGLNVGPVLGPCRIRMTVTPANTNAQTTRASYGYRDARSGAF